jgi:hypothetical protein
MMWSGRSSVRTETGPRLYDWILGAKFLKRKENFPFAMASTPALGSTYLPIQFVQEGLSPRGKAVKE